MGIVSKVVDAAVALFSLLAAVLLPLSDSQVVLPHRLYPAPLVGFHQWFVDEYDHYLFADPPPFFRGLFWLIVTFLWPVCVANFYGIIKRRRWVATTSLMAGVCFLTYLSAVFGEILGSGRATSKMIQLYASLLAFTVALVLRGLRSSSSEPDQVPPVEASFQKKKRV